VAWGCASLSRWCSARSYSRLAGKTPWLSSSDLHRPISTANSRQPSQHVMFVKSTTVFMNLLLPFYTDFAFLPSAKSNASSDARHELWERGATLRGDVNDGLRTAFLPSRCLQTTMDDNCSVCTVIRPLLCLFGLSTVAFYLCSFALGESSVKIRVWQRYRLL
jgi:hypothetical protein